MAGLFDDIPYTAPQSSAPAPSAPLQVTVTPRGPAQAGRGSWYSQLPEKGWVDRGDRPGSNALGVPDERQGIALPSRETLGQWFDVAGPDGTVTRQQQTDVGPAKWTGRGIDISAAAADRMGYSPKNFPTDAGFAWKLADGPPPATPIGSAMAGEAQASLPPKTGGLFDDVPDLPKPYQRDVSPSEAFLIGAEQGLTANFGDELRGVRAASGMQDVQLPRTALAARAVQPVAEGLVGLARLGYEYLTGGEEATNRAAEARDEFRQRAKLAEKQRPGMTLAGNVMGAVALPIPGAAAARAASTGARIGATALTGGAFGAAAGAGAGEDTSSRITGSLTGGATGAALGAALPAAAAAGRGVAAHLWPSGSSGMEVAAAAQRLGVDLPRAVTSDGMAAQQLGQAASLPFIAGVPLRRASEQAIRGIDEAAGRVEQGYGSGNAALAGAAVREGVTDYIKTETAKRADALYGKVDALINPKVTVPLNATQSTANVIGLRRQAAGLGDSQAVREVTDAISRPEGLTYEGAKTLRTRIGEMLDTGLLPAETSKGELKKVYGALTDDLRGIVKEAGGDRAVSAFDRANRYYDLVSNRRETLAKLLGTRSDEAIFGKLVRSASTGDGADIATLAQARKAIGPDGWNELSSAIIARMGRDASGDLTPDRFVTAFGKLSPEGKAMLFRSTGKADLADALDDISTVMTRFKSLNKFANPSGTAQNVTAIAGMGGLWINPLSVIAGATTAAGLSALLSRPTSAKAIAKWSNAYADAAAAKTPRSPQVLARATNALAATLAQVAGRPDLAGDLERKMQNRGDENADYPNSLPSGGYINANDKR